MQYEIYGMAEKIENSKLLAHFNTLEECDKEIVIRMSELLVEKYKLNSTSNVENNEKQVFYDFFHK